MCRILLDLVMGFLRFMDFIVLLKLQGTLYRSTFVKEWVYGLWILHEQTIFFLSPTCMYFVHAFRPSGVDSRIVECSLENKKTMYWHHSPFWLQNLLFPADMRFWLVGSQSHSRVLERPKLWPFSIRCSFSCWISQASNAEIRQVYWVIWRILWS